MSETILFEKDEIRITNQRAVFGAESFLIPEITSMVVGKVGPKPRGGVTLLFLILLGAGFLSANMGWVSVIIPLVLTIVFILWAVIIQLDETFTLHVITEERAVQVYASRSEKSVREVEDAIKKAILEAKQT